MEMKLNLIGAIVLICMVSAIAANPCADSSDGDLIQSRESCDEYYYCFDGVPQPRLCTYPLKFDPIEKMCHSDYTCDATMERLVSNNTLCNNVTNNVLIDNPESCAGFFFCFEDSAIYGVCPYPLQFDANSTKCDYPDNVNCEEPTMPPPTTVNPICMGENDFAFVDNPYVCDGFFVCINGYPHEGNCPYPLFFNPYTRECDWRDNVKCENYTTTEQPPTTTPGYEFCADMPNGAMIDNPYDCEGFFLCYDDVAFPGTCPYPLYFNPITHACDHRDNVTCEIANNVCDGVKDLELVNDPKSCAGYFICFRGSPIPQQCPSPFYFDAERNVCDFPENVNCTSVCDGLANGTLVPDVNDRQGYYFCLDGVGIHNRCYDGYYFDVQNQRCSFGYPTTSYPNTTEPEYNTTSWITTTEPEYNTTSWTTTESTYYNTTIEIETTTLSVCHGIANSSFVSDPHNCQGWFFCDNGVAIGWGACPDGFYFNEAEQVCDFEYNVICNISDSTLTE